MSEHPSELARRLAQDAEAVCRQYLSNGRREGRYWLVGDVHNTPGRSLFVRLSGAEFGKGAAGKWTDAATGDHGDLLDIIRGSCGLVDFQDVAAEARRFLCLPRPEQNVPSRPRATSAPAGSSESARRLFAMSQPISGTIAEAYLRGRGITTLHETSALRFHPRCYYRPDSYSPTETWPAMIAAVTDLADRITGAHRTWLDPGGQGKAPVDTPKRAMGHLLGNAVRCRPRISPPSCFHQRYAASTSSVTTIRQVTARWQAWSTGRPQSESRRFACPRRWKTSTRICAHSASMPFGRP